MCFLYWGGLFRGNLRYGVHGVIRCYVEKFEHSLLTLSNLKLQITNIQISDLNLQIIDITNLKFELSSFKFELFNYKSQIWNYKSDIKNLKSAVCYKSHFYLKKEKTYHIR